MPLSLVELLKRIVHKKFHPMIGRIKDYISLPKPNGYQSIHTTVFGPDGRVLETMLRKHFRGRKENFLLRRLRLQELVRLLSHALPYN